MGGVCSGHHEAGISVSPVLDPGWAMPIVALSNGAYPRGIIAGHCRDFGGGYARASNLTIYQWLRATGSLTTCNAVLNLKSNM